MRETASPPFCLVCRWAAALFLLFCNTGTGMEGADTPINNPGGIIEIPVPEEDNEGMDAVDVEIVQPAIRQIAPSTKPAGRFFPATTNSDILDFINRDRLHGKLLSAVPAEYGIRWKQDNSDRESNYALSSISMITLLQRPAEKKSAHNSAIRLTNDDILEGDIVSLDDAKLVISTWYSGRTEIKREMVKQLNPNTPATAPLYVGPNSISEWTISTTEAAPRRWKFRNGALCSMGDDSPINLAITNMPDMVEFQFDASSRFNDCYFAFFTENLTETPGKHYELVLNGSSVDLQRATKTENDNSTESLGSISMDSDIDADLNAIITTTHYNIFADRKKKSFSLVMNGQLVKQWTDTSSFSTAGNGIYFASMNSPDLKIRNIRICRWNGQMPGQSDVITSATNDVVRLINMDKVSGQVKSITENTVLLITPNGNLNIPVARVTSIDLACDRHELARRNKHDIRAVFASQGTATIQLVSLDKDKVSGTSENFGTMSIPLGALRAIEFNIYRGKDPEEDDSDF